MLQIVRNGRERRLVRREPISRPIFVKSTASRDQDCEAALGAIARATYKLN
jgi:hypothetical protein